MERRKYTTEEKLWAVKQVKSGEDSINHIATILGADRKSISEWIDHYELWGEAGLSERQCKQPYSSSQKEAAVLDYLGGNGSLQEITKKYKLRSSCQLRQWIKLYNGHKELKASGTGGRFNMTKGRKTTYEERIEIVKYCIDNRINYGKTAEKYQVSYQQVYGWVQKYNAKGIEGLLDQRGKRKSKDEMSELEKLRAENKILQAEKRRAELEVTFLKKLNEIERGRS